MLLEKYENLLELSVKQLLIQLNLATSIPLVQTTLREEILAGRNFSGKKIWRIWRNLIWRMPKNYKFGGNLIWRIREK